MITWDNKYKWGMYVINIPELCTVLSFNDNDILIQLSNNAVKEVMKLIDYKYNQVKHMLGEGKFIVRMKGNELTLSLLKSLHPIRKVTPKITATCEINGKNIHCKLWLL